jgi:uncharacterized membrane protein YdbT with pleckstrin-like domain
MALSCHDQPVVISQSQLNEGEHVVLSTRTHVKVLIGALLTLLVTVFVAAFLAALVRKNIDEGAGRTTLMVVIAVLTVAILFWWVVRKFVNWFTTTYTFTNRRFIQRSGFIAKKGTTIPLNRISEVDFDIGLIDRIFGCGTLYVSDASESGRVPLKDIPRVEEVQRVVAEELHKLTQPHESRPSTDDGT